MVLAEPSVALVGVHARGKKLAATKISTGLSSVAPQRSAACWKAIRRCCPSVVPVLPPTGARGVGSLKPTLGLLVLTIVMVADPRTGADAARPATRRTIAS